MATQKKQQDRELTVIGRYAMKTKKVLNGHVCTKVRNSEGAEYQVWTHANGCTSSCECEGYQKFHKVCYHIRFVEAREQLRKAGKSTANTAVLAMVTASTPAKKATAPAAKKPVSSERAEQQKQEPVVVATTEPTTITDEDVEAVLAEIDALAQPVAETAAAVVATEPVKVVETPAPRKKEMSSVEREMPAFLMAGGSRGGYLPGRATTAAKKKAS